MSSEIIERTLKIPSIIKDEQKLSIDYVPLHLPHREKELTRLSNMFRVMIEKPGSMAQKVIITGQVGTGKTAVAKLFGDRIKNLAREKSVNLHYYHFNCHKERTLFNIIRRLALTFYPTLPDRGFSVSELFGLIRDFVDEHNLHLLICLDEVSFLVKTSNDDPLYLLTRTADEKLNSAQRLSILLISRDQSFMDELDESTQSTLLHNIIAFEAYTLEQLRDILEERAVDALHPGTYDGEVLDTIAENGEFNGDARYVLELLWRAAKYADEEGAQRILPEHVRRAASNVALNLRLEDLSVIPRPELLILLSVARALKSTQKAHVTMSEMEEVYRLVCEEFEEKPRGHAQVFEYIQNLKSMDVITAKTSGPGFRGRTTLIGLPDIPLDILEREIVRLYEKGAEGDEGYV